MWPGFDSQTGRHMWVEFVGSLLCTERFSPGTPGTKGNRTIKTGGDFSNLENFYYIAYAYQFPIERKDRAIFSINSPGKISCL